MNDQRSNAQLALYCGNILF